MPRPPVTLPLAEGLYAPVFWPRPTAVGILVYFIPQHPYDPAERSDDRVTQPHPHLLSASLAPPPAKPAFSLAARRSTDASPQPRRPRACKGSMETPRETIELYLRHHQVAEGRRLAAAALFADSMARELDAALAEWKEMSARLRRLKRDLEFPSPN